MFVNPKIQIFFYFSPLLPAPLSFQFDIRYSLFDIPSVFCLLPSSTFEFCSFDFVSDLRIVPFEQFARGGMKKWSKNGAFLLIFANFLFIFVNFCQFLSIFALFSTTTCVFASKTCVFDSILDKKPAHLLRKPAHLTRFS